MCLAPLLKFMEASWVCGDGLTMWKLADGSIIKNRRFPKNVEAYSKPVRIIRGKQIESAWEVLAVFT